MTKKNTNIFDRFGSSAKRNENKRFQFSFLLVFEGEKTEFHYFQSFKKKDGINCYIECAKGDRKTSCDQILARAIRLKKETEYDSVWIVFDKDNNDDKKFNSTINKAKKEKIKTAWSNECFELWYVLHFQDCTSGIPRKDYKSLIEKGINRIKKDKGFLYDKSLPNMYEILEQFGNQEAAIKRSKKCSSNFDDKSYANHNPSTTVCSLVEELNGNLDKLAQKVGIKLEKDKTSRKKQ